MKREYTAPEMEVTWLEREDVITNSVEFLPEGQAAPMSGWGSGSTE